MQSQTRERQGEKAKIKRGKTGKTREEREEKTKKKKTRTEKTVKFTTANPPDDACLCPCRWPEQNDRLEVVNNRRAGQPANQGQTTLSAV
jgi:hypothetical protein